MGKGSSSAKPAAGLRETRREVHRNCEPADANGNTLSDAQGRSYTWDFENRLVQAVNPGVGTTTFKYDPFGRRIQKSGPLGTTNYLYDGLNLKANPVEELDNSGNILARYTESDLVDEPLAEARGTNTSYYEADALGSITSVSNPAASMTNSYIYDAFGNLTTTTGTLTNPFQFTGRDSDPETSLYYYRARYYSPQIGRFLSEDPIRFGGGTDFFAYVHNNPARFKDSSGLLGIDSSCDCGGFDKNNLQSAAQQALAAAALITDSKLRNCIIDHLNKGKVMCGGKRCDKGSKPDSNGNVTAGWAMPWGNTIHLCGAANGSDPRLACIMIHEMAHTCGHPGEGTPDKAMNQAFPGQCPQ